MSLASNLSLDYAVFYAIAAVELLTTDVSLLSPLCTERLIYAPVRHQPQPNFNLLNMQVTET